MGKTIWVIILIVVVVLLWFLFRGDSSQEPEAITEETSEEAGEGAVIVKEGDVLPETVEKLRDITATAAGVSRDEVTVIKYKKTVWPNGCLGSVPPEGEDCTEGEVPGYGGQFQVGETIYDYHANDDASEVVLHGTLKAGESEESETTEE